VDKYRRDYPEWRLNRDLVIAGAILHDIGKLREVEVTPAGGAYTPAGELIGHVLLGRDMLREAAAGKPIDAETLLRLEHIIVSHQRLPEWGSPKPPMTPEALLVHYADDLDAKLHAAHEALAEPGGNGFVTSNRNALGQKLFRGLPGKMGGA
jgi:3'-5' exoribonuclease